MKIHAKVVFNNIPARGTDAEVVPDTYPAVVTKIKTEFRRLVNRTMAMHELLTTKQGERNWILTIRHISKTMLPFSV